MRYHQVRVISGKGSGPGQFSEALNGICVDSTGLIYAVGDSYVKVLDALGKLQRQWRTEKPGYCVAAGGDSSIYVGEAGQVEEFDRFGKHRATWRDAARLGVVTAIGFSGDFILAADAKDRCIRRYDSGGRWLNDIGKDNKTKGFLIPNGHLDFSVDAERIVHAANPGKHRVERYTLAGELLGHFGRFGTRRPEDFPGCCNPTNLTLMQQGQVVVTEKAAPRLKVYDAAGKLLALVGPEAFDANCKNMDVAVDARDWIYVVDTARLHICVFAPDKSGVEANHGTSSPTVQGDSEP